MVGLSNPQPVIWTPRRVPVLLVRFFTDLHTENARPIAEHVYKPSGMYFYKKGEPTIFHYEYQLTRKVEPCTTTVQSKLAQIAEQKK